MTEGKEPDPEKREEIEDLVEIRPSVIYEAIRLEGEEELARNFRALWWSGVAAGLAISTSVMAKASFEAVLPDEAWTPAVSNLGYALGFVIVILGRMQLFTENTITPVLSLLRNPQRRTFLGTARLWAIVLSANLVGCLVAAAALTLGVVPPPQMAMVLALSSHYAEVEALQHLLWGIPAGFLLAALVWIMPRLEGAGAVLGIVVVTYIIGLAGLSHVVAGSTELFVMVLAGELGLGDALLTGVLPAFVGNVIGGTGMFATLTYAQLREEL